MDELRKIQMHIYFKFRHTIKKETKKYVIVDVSKGSANEIANANKKQYTLNRM